MYCRARHRHRASNGKEKSSKSLNDNCPPQIRVFASTGPHVTCNTHAILTELALSSQLMSSLLLTSRPKKLVTVQWRVYILTSGA